MNSTNITVTRIGSVSLGIDGSDEYLLLSSSTDELTVGQVEEYCHQHFYRNTNAIAGGYYCHTWCILPHPVLGNKSICIIHHRYDV